MITIKKKRSKPFPAKSESRKHLESEGWTVADVEKIVPHHFIKQDCFGFGDLLCSSPRLGIMLVQSTAHASTSNLRARVLKIKSEPRAAVWLASGGKIQVHSWEGKGKERVLHIFNITKTDH